MTELTVYSPFSSFLEIFQKWMPLFVVAMLCVDVCKREVVFRQVFSNLLTISKLKELKRSVPKNLCCSSNATDIDRMLLHVAQLKTPMMDTINERVSQVAQLYIRQKPLQLYKTHRRPASVLLFTAQHGRKNQDDYDVLHRRRYDHICFSSLFSEQLVLDSSDFCDSN